MLAFFQPRMEDGPPRPLDRLERYATPAESPVYSQQQPFSDSPLGYNQRPGQQDTLYVCSASARRLGSYLWLSSPYAGDPGGSVPVPWYLLPGGQLDMAVVYPGTGTYGPGTQCPRSLGQRHLHLPLALSGRETIALCYTPCLLYRIRRETMSHYHHSKDPLEDSLRRLREENENLRRKKSQIEEEYGHLEKENS